MVRIGRIDKDEIGLPVLERNLAGIGAENVLARRRDVIAQRAPSEIASDIEPPAVRALKIIFAQYFEPLFPGDALTLQASILEEDGMIAVCAGQILRQGKIVSLSLQEVYFVQ